MQRMILTGVVVLGILMAASDVAESQGRPGIPERVSALEEQISNLKSWVVLDAEGDRVGEFMGFVDYYVTTKVEFGGDAGTLLLTEGGVIPNATLFYMEYGCRGEAWASKNMGSHFFDDVLFVYGLYRPGYVAPFRIDESRVPRSQYGRSYVGGDGVCRTVPGSSARYLYPVEPTPLTSENLRDVYPGPIEVVRR